MIDATTLAIAHETVVELSPTVWRITTDNPSIMTGPGTNSYLLLGHDAAAIVDPGPESDTHLQALLTAVTHSQRPLRAILLTHTHRDHSPGTAALVAATGARVYAIPPLADDPSQDRHSVIDETLSDGQRLDALLGWPLQVVHTPGHVENHVCFFSPDEGWLITGDHIIQGSTVVIIPPHGKLLDYMRSLQKIADLDVHTLLPGHGTVIHPAKPAILGTLAHRQQRENKVVSAIASGERLSLESWVTRVYDDVPEHLHPIARLSLWAHLLKLESEQRVQHSEGLWYC